MRLAPAERDAAKLRAVARAYLRQIDALRYRDVRLRQDPPWGSVACGAAGIAAALHHARRPRRRAAVDLAGAERWLRAAARNARAPGAFWALDARSLHRRSIHYSEDGIRFVRLLVAAARGQRADRALAVFVARCRGTLGGDVELAQGAAGYLTALVILHARSGAPRALDAADEIAADLLARAHGADGWARAAPLGFAHGRAGVLHALLTWSLVGRRELPASFFDALAAFGADAERGGIGASTADARAIDAARASWCNGAAGFVLVWAKAYERTGERRHLRAARDAARLLTAIDAGAGGDLCCGLAGRAYALLAMDRVDPNRAWHARALATGAAAAQAMLDAAGPWPNGLYKGYPGLVCLARDLARAAPERVGFPLVEG